MAAMDFPLNPTAGQIFTAPGGAPTYIYDGSKWIGSGSQGGVATAGFRNAIINGNFDIWQRGVTSLPAATGTRFFADRWRAEFVGSTIAALRGVTVPGSTVPPFEPNFYVGFPVVSVAGANNYALHYQTIESVRTFAGQQVTLSWYASADAARPMSVDIFQNFGTGGSPSTAVETFVAKVNLATPFQGYSVTFTVPSILGKTIGSNGDDFLAVRFWFDAGSTYNAYTSNLGQQSGTFYMASVQLEPGAVPTPFERRHIGQELALCQRYFEAGRVYGGFACPAAGGYAQNFYAQFKVTKRASPTMTRSYSAGTNVQAYTPVGVGPNNDADAVQVSGTGLLNVTFQWDWTASAEI